MKVKILQLDVPNKNDRTYTIECVQDSLGKEFLGCIGFPPGVNGVPLEEASHKVGNLRIEDGYLIGDIVVLDTPKGKDLSSILNGVDFRTRGTGIIENGVVKNYKLISIDAVYDGA